MLFPSWYRTAIADALALEQAEAKLRAVLGCGPADDLPWWVHDEIGMQAQTHSIPVPGPTGLPDYLRYPTRREAIELVLAMVVEGEIP